MTIEEPTHMYCDNKAAINIMNNHVFHDCTKHIEIDHHFIKEKIDSKELVLSYIKLEDQMADMFIKSLSYRIFEKNISWIC